LNINLLDIVLEQCVYDSVIKCCNQLWISVCVNWSLLNVQLHCFGIMNEIYIIICYWLCNSTLLTTRLYCINDKLKISPSLNLTYVILPMEVIKWHIVEFGRNQLIFLIIIFNSAIYCFFTINAYFALLLGKPVKTVCSFVTFKQTFPVADVFHMPSHIVRAQWGWLRLASNIVPHTVNLLFYIPTSCILHDCVHFL